MTAADAIVLNFYGTLVSGLIYLWWTRWRKQTGFTSVKLIRRSSYSDYLKYPYVTLASAEAALRAHQTGNRGPQLLSMKSGASASVDISEFAAVEIGT